MPEPTNSLDVSKEQGKIDGSSQTSESTSGETVKKDETSKEGADETAGATGGEHDWGPDSEGKYEHPDTKTKVSADDIAKYYKDKFANSTAGAQKLLDDIKTITNERDLSKSEVTKFEKQVEDLRKIAEGDNPEGLALHDLQASLASTTNELALIKENSALDGFEKTVPLATNKREALRNLARANPKESLQSLWDTYFKAGVEAEVGKRKDDEEKRKKSAGEKGKGSSTRETAGDTVKSPSGFDTGLSLEEFNKLPVGKRRDFLAK